MKQIIVTVHILIIAQNLCTANQITSPKEVKGRSNLLSDDDFSKDTVFEKSKNVLNSSENTVYMEGVIYALKNQNWTEEDMPCINKTLVLLRNLQNLTLWAVWEWDSMSSEPLGLLYGSQYHLGNYDECLNTPWRDSHPELRSKYCLADIELHRTGKHKLQWDRNDPYQSALELIETKNQVSREIKKLTWGMCVPAECAPRAVQRLTRVMLAHSHLSMAGLTAHITVDDDACQDVYEDTRYDNLFYAFIILIIVLVAVVMICTMLNDRTDKYKGVGSGMIKAFDMQSNISSMMKPGKDLQALYGVRFLSMCLVVMGHELAMFNAGPVSNGVNVDEYARYFPGFMILRVDVVVDSYYMLSGFLTAATVTKMKNLPNPLIIIFKRWTRLVVPYAMVIFWVAAVYPYMGSGPLWNRAAQVESGACRRSWWLNLLMVSNYVRTDDACIIVSWYIPSDFHFFVVSLLLWEVYRRSPALGKLLVATITIASVVLPGVATYIHHYPVTAFSVEFLINPRSGKIFNEFYIKSHMRYSTYLIGFISGFIYVRPTLIARLKKLSQAWLTTITYVSAVIIIACMILGSIIFWREYNATVSAVYAALNRPLWALGLSLIVLCCSISHVPFIKAILSWYPWVPLSRLSYGVYLIHTVLIMRNVFVTRNLQNYDQFQLATLCAGTLFWSHVAALLLWLVAETPINNLVTLIMKQAFKKNEPSNNTVKQTNTYKNKSYLEDNLQPKIDNSSPA